MSVRKAVSVTIGIAVSVAIGITVSISVGVSVRMPIAIPIRRVTTVIPIAICRPISILHRHIHFSLVALVVLRPYRRQEINEEAQDVEEVDEGYGPFQDGSNIVFLLISTDTKCDGEREFNNNEGELDPEGVAEDRGHLEVVA